MGQIMSTMRQDCQQRQRLDWQRQQRWQQRQQWSSGRRHSGKKRRGGTTNNDDNATKQPTILTLRPTTEHWEEARQQEKAWRMINNNDDDVSRPLTMTMTTMTMMTMSCQSLPFFNGFFIFWLIVMGWSFFGGKLWVSLQVDTNRCRHHQFCVGNTDPSGQNWSDILCRDDMLPTCCQHFQLKKVWPCFQFPSFLHQVLQGFYHS